MKKTISLTLALLVFASFGFPLALGYDASNPYSVTLNWIVPSDTTFTVALAGIETTIDFNPINKSSAEVQADSQNSTTPIITITNQGNVNSNYSALVTADKPTWVDLKGYNSYTYGSAVSVGNVSAISIETDVTPASSSEYWLWSDFTDAPSGTLPTTFQISAVAS